MAERGAFDRLGPTRVAAFTYIHLGGEGAEETTTRDEGEFDKAWAGLERLIGHYLQAGNGYPSRRAVFETKFEGDYDHLARFGEWQMGDAPDPEDVG